MVYFKSSKWQLIHKVKWTFGALESRVRRLKNKGEYKGWVFDSLSNILFFLNKVSA
jgi:hypothetical protein